MLKKIKCKWVEFIKRIAASNASHYGSKGLNCCDLKDKN